MAFSLGLGRSVGTKILVALLAVSLAPTAVMGIVPYLRSQQLMTEQELRSMNMLARQCAESVGAWLKETLLAVRMLAADQSVVERRASLDRMEYTLNRFMRTYSACSLTALVSATGEPISMTSFVIEDVTGQPWFKQAVTGEIFVSDVEWNEQLKEQVVTVAAPVRDIAGRIDAVAVTWFSAEKSLWQVVDGVARELEAAHRKGYGVLASSSGLVLAHPDRSVVHKLNLVEDQTLSSIGKEMVAGKEGHAFYTFGGAREVMAYQPVKKLADSEGLGWSVGVTQTVAGFMAPLGILRSYALIVAAVTVAGVCLAALVVSRSISVPIRQGVEFANRIADGDLSARFSVSSRDEVAELASALNRMVSGVIGEGVSFKQGVASPYLTVDTDLRVTGVNTSMSELVGRQAEELVGGESRPECREVLRTDLCGRDCPMRRALHDGQPTVGAKATVELAGGRKLPVLIDVAALRDLDGNIVGGLEIVRDNSMQAETEGEVKRAALDLARTSGELSSMSGDASRTVNEVAGAINQVASGASEQIRHMQQTSSTLNGLVEAVRRIAGLLDGLVATANKTAEASRAGYAVIQQNAQTMTRILESVRSTGQAVRELGASSQKIGSIVQLIDDISGQTNLLALNAAIEAARAAEHGRGFAVVADEVRKLAEGSSRSAKSIADLVAAMQQGIVSSQESMTAGIREVEEGVRLSEQTAQSFAGISGLVDQTLAGIQSIAGAVARMSESSDQISSAFQDVATVADENAAATEEVSASASELNASIEQLAASAQSLAKLAEDLTALAGRLAG